MQQPEQTLPAAEQDKLALLDRWLKHQGTVDDVLAEREKQFEQWGVQDIPIGTGHDYYKAFETYYRTECQAKTADGTVTFLDVLLEEVFEFASEADPAKARDELIQVLAVGFQIVEAIDRRASGASA